MTPNLKKIIAREGLIIISLVTVFAVCLFLEYQQNTHISKRTRPSNKEFNSVLNQVKKLNAKTMICPNGKKLQFDSTPIDDDIYWACTVGSKDGAPQDLGKVSDKQLYERAEIPLKDRPLFQRINFLSLGLFFLLFAYPSTG